MFKLINSRALFLYLGFTSVFRTWGFCSPECLASLNLRKKVDVKWLECLIEIHDVSRMNLNDLFNFTPRLHFGPNDARMIDLTLINWHGTLFHLCPSYLDVSRAIVSSTYVWQSKGLPKRLEGLLFRSRHHLFSSTPQVLWRIRRRYRSQCTDRKKKGWMEGKPESRWQGAADASSSLIKTDRPLFFLGQAITRFIS